MLVSPGWLAVYGKEAQGDEASLAPVKPNEKVATEKVDVVRARHARRRRGSTRRRCCRRWKARAS